MSFILVSEELTYVINIFGIVTLNKSETKYVLKISVDQGLLTVSNPFMV